VLYDCFFVIYLQTAEILEEPQLDIATATIARRNKAARSITIPPQPPQPRRPLVLELRNTPLSTPPPVPGALLGWVPVVGSTSGGAPPLFKPPLPELLDKINGAIDLH